METSEAIRTRRSIRSFVQFRSRWSAGDIQEILTAAMYVPRSAFS